MDPKSILLLIRPKAKGVFPPSHRIMLAMKKPKGKIIIQSGANPWPHELKTAESLAAIGYVVEFIKKSEADHEHTADVYLDGGLWEMKAPISSSLKAIERNIRRGLDQSSSIVFDSRRMRGLPDAAIEREVNACVNGRIKGLVHLIYINRKGNVIDKK